VHDESVLDPEEEKVEECERSSSSSEEDIKTPLKEIDVP